MKRTILVIISVVSTLLVVFVAAYATEYIIVGNKLEEIILDSNSGFVNRTLNKNKDIITDEMYEDIYVVSHETSDFDENNISINNIKLDFKMKPKLSFHTFTSGEFRFKMMYRLNAKNGTCLEGGGTEEDMINCIVYWKFGLNGLKIYDYFEEL